MRKIRIFGCVNHLSHNYELVKLAKHYPIEITYLENNIRRWSRWSHQPMPDYLNWTTYYEPGKYDVAILHVDQQYVDPNIGKARLYRSLNKIITDIPKIVINHGTPMYDPYDEDMVINGGTTFNSKGKPVRLEGMKELIGDNFMVVNSYESVNRWGWGYPIIHGIDPDEWEYMPKEPRVAISLSPGGLDKYYNRSLITAIKAEVSETVGHNITHFNVNFLPKDGYDYKLFFASSLLHIYPFKDSPMPRSRTEAMMTGSVVLSSKYHNANEFIQTGKNGFIVPDNPILYADTISQLLNYNYRECVDIGRNARNTAIKYFNAKDFRSDWWELLNYIIEGKKPIWKGNKRWTK